MSYSYVNESRGQVITNQVTHLATSAEAAKKSADAFVTSERAWVQLHFAKQPIVQVSGEGDIVKYERIWFWPDIMNYGRTPAKITRIIVVTCLMPKPLGSHVDMPPSLPATPIYEADNQRRVIGIERDMMLAPQMGITPLPVEVRGHEWEAITQRKMTLYMYGFIDYFDVSGTERQTGFCEVYWIRNSPNDPNQPGFVTAGNTPAAYTHST